MTRRVVLRPRAETDIDQYFEFLAVSSVEAAIRFLDGIRETLGAIKDRPSIGSAREFGHTTLTGLRSLPVRGFPKHLIFYKAQEPDVILVVRVLHGAMDLQEHLRAEELN